VMRHDITFPLYVEVDEIYNLACPAAPIHYQYNQVPTTPPPAKSTVTRQSTLKRKTTGETSTR
jgi:UDP-glucuronate decarboxylase